MEATTTSPKPYTEETCSRCGGTRFATFAAPSGRKRRCANCAQPAPKETAEQVFSRIAWSQTSWMR